MVFVPLVGALAQAARLGRFGDGRLPAWLALGSSLLSTALAFALVLGMRVIAEPQATESVPWVGSYAITYAMGLDGLNVLPLLGIAAVFPVLIAHEWDRAPGRRGMHALLLLLQSSWLGAVCAQDLFLQFLFWGLSALPLFFLVGIWGGPRREQVALRLAISSTLGNVLVLAALVLVYFSSDPPTFLLHDLMQSPGPRTLPREGGAIEISGFALALLGLGLGLRSPIWPFHSGWIQVAREAPTSVFVALAGLSPALILYLFARTGLSLFPQDLVQLGPVLVGLGVCSLVIGGLSALAQRELPMLVAYLCVAEMGAILLGFGSLTKSGAVGAIFQSGVAGLGIAGLALVSGILVAKSGKREFRAAEGEGTGALIRGVARTAPALAATAAVFVATLVGFPGLGGFLGRSLLMIGSFPVHPWTLVAFLASFLLFAYVLMRMYRHVFLYPLAEPDPGPGCADLTLRERLYLLPWVAITVAIGLYPRPVLELIQPTLLTLLSLVKPGG